jgi:hypothetical protein
LQREHQRKTPSLQPALVPPTFLLDDAAAAAINAQWLTDDERQSLRIYHGVWDDRDLTTPARRAAVALNAWDFAAPSLLDPSVPVEIRAEAKLLAGDLQEALALLEGARSNQAARNPG